MVPWGTCDNYWNTETCLSAYTRVNLTKSIKDNVTFYLINGTEVAATTLTDPVKEYWEYVIPRFCIFKEVMSSSRDCFYIQAPSPHDLWWIGRHWRSALGIGGNSGRGLVHVLFLHLERCQVDRESKCLCHGCLYYFQKWRLIVVGWYRSSTSQPSFPTFSLRSSWFAEWHFQALRMASRFTWPPSLTS